MTWLTRRRPRLDAIAAVQGKPNYALPGELTNIPRDEAWTSYDGSSQYLDNQWMMFT